MNFSRRTTLTIPNVVELIRRTSLPIAVWCLIVLASLLYNLSAIKQHYIEVNREHARAFVRQVIITRSWNARHGGVYVPISEQSPANPYLDAPDRDVTTTTGVKLTKINPAYMTRQIAEIAQDAQGVSSISQARDRYARTIGLSCGSWSPSGSSKRATRNGTTSTKEA